MSSTNYSVTLSGPAPWGFRLQGGKDFNMPLTISRMTEGGKAAQAQLNVGDMLLSIDGVSTDGMTHLEAQNKIKSCAGNLNLTLQKVSSAPKPTVVPKGEQTDIHKPLAHLPHPHPTPSILPPTAPKPTWSAGGVGACEGGGRPPARSPLSPFIPSPSSAFTPPPPPPPPGSAPFPGPPQSSVYNTPINLYSNENACEVAMGQRRGLLQSQGGTLPEFNGAPPRKHVVDTDIQFYHIPSHGDASRTRIMEDTEDWRPRAGTTQSRSFRILAQITGTEHAPEKESEDKKKKPDDDTEEAERSAHESSSVKTMTKTPAAAHGVPRPGHNSGIITPSFSVRGGVAVVPKVPVVPERPAPQPHPKDEASLVQRAEHIPAGTRTPMCAHCDQVIRGPFLVAMGRAWHPEEFTCTHCSTSLAELGFVEEQGVVYCEHCYEELFAPTCARCQLKILGEVINALKQAWHVHCFLCASCQQPIRNNTFHLEDGEPYCEQDYYSLFGTGCHGCEFPIEAGDRFLEVLGHTWHDTCFACAVCCTPLEGQTFFSKKDKPLCKKHAHTVQL